MYSQSFSPLKFIAAAVFILAAGGYAAYRSWDFIRGPAIVLASPADGETIRDPVLALFGEAHRISFLSLNGRQIFTDAEGMWQETVILFPGYNALAVEAKDRFGRETREVRRLILAEAPAPPPLPVSVNDTATTTIKTSDDSTITTI